MRETFVDVIKFIGKFGPRSWLHDLLFESVMRCILTGQYYLHRDESGEIDEFACYYWAGEADYQRYSEGRILAVPLDISSGRILVVDNHVSCRKDRSMGLFKAMRRELRSRPGARAAWNHKCQRMMEYSCRFNKEKAA